MCFVHGQCQRIFLNQTGTRPCLFYQIMRAFPIAYATQTDAFFDYRGDRAALPGGGLLQGTVQIVIGPPIDSTDRRAGEVTSEVERWIEGTMHDIVP